MKMNTINSKIYRKIEDTISKVAGSYTYEEIVTEGTGCIMCETCDVLKNELNDEIFPVRLYNRSKKDAFLCVLFGETSHRADGEILSVAINSLIGLGIKEFKVKLSHIEKDDDKTETLFEYLESIGLSDFIDVDYDLKPSKRATSFAYEAKAGDITLFKGAHSNEDIEKAFVKFFINDIIKFVKTDKDTKSNPVALVASANPSDAYKIAFGLRARGLDVREYIASTSMIDAEEYGEISSISILIWVNEDKIIMKNLKTGEMSETTSEKLLS